MIPAAVTLAALLLSAALTWALRRYALTRGVLDVPNARSSHTVPTPRGGGVAIVVAFLLGVLALAASGALPLPIAAALAGAGLVTAAVGFWDDHAPLAARWRLAAHFAAAAVALAALGGMPAIRIVGAFDLAGWPAQVVGVVAIVWLLNLYNFMDGIDGIAGIEAVTVSFGGAAVALVAGHQSGAVACLLLAAASGGFLLWNFPPAKIFMGDAGSGFLGVAFGVLAIDATRHDARLLWCWLILLGAFAVDATVTLLRRLLRGERVYQAHRSHAYQNAARRLGAHRPVSLAVGAVNLLWLLPLALLVATGRIAGEVALLVAWLPLAVLALRLRAGLPD